MRAVMSHTDLYDSNNPDYLAILLYLVGKLQPFFHSQPDVKALKEIYYKERLNKYLLCLLWISFYV